MSILEYQGCKTVTGSSNSQQITGQSNSLAPGEFVGAWVNAAAACSFTVWDSNVSTTAASAAGGIIKLWSYVKSSMDTGNYTPTITQRVRNGIFVNASNTTDYGVCFM